MKQQEEWKISVPWGKLVLCRWGDPKGLPVLLVHGRQDSCSVFKPLLNMMPDTYEYVALDMPGNGLSDPFPLGPKLMRFHFLAAMEFAVEHLGWDQFIFIGHSMGCEQGLFFNVVHPNRITKMVLLDPCPTFIKMQIEDPVEYQRSFFDSYYENYHRENFIRKTYTRYTALQAIKKARDLTDQQGMDLLERNFHETTLTRENPNEAGPTEEAQNSGKAQTQELSQTVKQMPDTCIQGYISWDYRLRSLAPQNYGNEYYFQLFKTIPPTLVVAASHGAKNASRNPEHHTKAKELMKKMSKLDNYYQVNVEGSHDVHYTNPERVVSHIIQFLSGNFKKNSKL